MSFDNIPAELRALPQWLVWRYENDGGPKPTKVPYSAKTGQLASVSDAATWSEFDGAVKTNASGNFDGIGLVLTSNDPFAFIDLDDTEGNNADLERQQKVFREFDSYAEVSPSGKGLHIIVKGAIPSGRRRAHIEVYSSLRYATFTGIVHSNKPIADRQELLTLLWQQLGGGQVVSAFTGDPEQRLSDEAILEQARKAANGDKFKQLEVRDGWKTLYTSQSEADFAFVDMVAFYTQNREQILRIFRNSALGQRQKAKRSDYMEYMLNRCFDRMLPPVDLDLSRIQLDEVLARKANGAAVLTADDQIEMFRNGAAPQSGPPVGNIPPGLVGDIARFLYAASPRPVPEIAITGAIGLMAGIAGRAFNVSGTGLNQYILLLAATGTGKEAIPSGISKLMNAVRTSVAASQEFLGPAEIASGQALIKYITKAPCFVTILGEFGLRLQQLSSAQANPSEIQLRRTLLDLYNKSGQNDILRPAIYSDKEKNTEPVQSPSLTICGESTPERFYANLDEEMITEGLLPRFLILEYTGPRPALSENHMQAQPPLPLVESLSSFAAYCLTLMHQQRAVNVQLNDATKRIFEDYERYTTGQINAAQKDIVRHLWNRAHIKALKLSALIAVGVNPNNPIIVEEHAKWALDLVNHDVHIMLTKFREGAIGKNSDETKQLREVQRMIKDYMTEPYNPIYGTPRNLHDAHIIPMSYLARRLIAIAAFRTDRSGATNALKRAVMHFVDAGDISEVPRSDLLTKYGTAPRSFVVTNLGMVR